MRFISKIGFISLTRTLVAVLALLPGFTTSADIVAMVPGVFIGCTAVLDQQGRQRDALRIGPNETARFISFETGEFNLKEIDRSGR